MALTVGLTVLTFVALAYLLALPGLSAADATLLSFLLAPLLSPFAVLLLNAYWLRRGQTLGKALLSLLVVRHDKSAVGFLRMFARQGLQVVIVAAPCLAYLGLITGGTGPANLGLFLLLWPVVIPAAFVIPLARWHWTIWDYALKTDVVRRTKGVST